MPRPARIFVNLLTVTSLLLLPVVGWLWVRWNTDTIRSWLAAREQGEASG